MWGDQCQGEEAVRKCPSRAGEMRTSMYRWLNNIFDTLFLHKLPTIHFSVVISRSTTYGWQNKPSLGGLVWPNDLLKVGPRGTWDLSVQSFYQYSPWVHPFYSAKVRSFKMANYPQRWAIPNKGIGVQQL